MDGFLPAPTPEVEGAAGTEPCAQFARGCAIAALTHQMNAMPPLSATVWPVM